MSVLLNKHSLNVHEFAAQEESRYTLRAIHVTEQETVATNGHYLVRVSHPTEKPENFPTVEGFRNGAAFKPFLFAVDAVKQLLKALPKGKTVKSLPILAHACVGHYEENGESKPNISVTDLENQQVVTPKTVPGQFPNWQAVIPTAAPKFEIYVSAEYLAQLARSAAQFSDCEMPVIRLQFTDANSAIRIDARNNETGQGFTGVVMPVRADRQMVCNAGNYPDHISKPKPPETVKPEEETGTE